MYFEPTDRTLVDIYSCKGCKKIYHRQLGTTFAACAVMHGPGSCCHYGEREVTGEQVDKIRALLGFAVPQRHADGSVTLEITIDGATGANITTTNDDPGYNTI